MKCALSRKVRPELTVGGLAPLDPEAKAPGNGLARHASDATQALRDPVCGMPVTAQSEHDHQLVPGGPTYYFCSAHCKARFIANPNQFLTSMQAGDAALPEPVTMAPAGAIYTCPMHPEVRQDHPGNCPKCGMALEPELPAMDADENSELRDFEHRFWWTLPLTARVFVLAMFGYVLGWMDMAVRSWVELALSTPMVPWAGARFLGAAGCRW